jgi:tRNA uridine 5-carboxymethylaminomethyl modification enzyme
MPVNMFDYPDGYDVIVVGAGHAGCEAALAAARMGAKVLVLTGSIDTVAHMSCNPAIGGVAKGHLVKEIDALGGEMASVIDVTGIQFRRLNASKGPAVRSTRAQADKRRYRDEMRGRLEQCPGLALRQGEVSALGVDESPTRPRIVGVETSMGIRYRGRAVILTTGTFLRGAIFVGETRASATAAGAAQDRHTVSSRSPHPRCRRTGVATRRRTCPDVSLASRWFRETAVATGAVLDHLHQQRNPRRDPRRDGALSLGSR